MHYDSGIYRSTTTQTKGNDMNDTPIKAVERMLAVGTPLIVLDSHDHPHTVGRLMQLLKSKERPVLAWNMADGLHAANEAGEAAYARLDQNKVKQANASGLHAILHIAQDFAPGCVLIVDNIHWQIDKSPVMQTLLNLREPFKATKRAVIGLGLNTPIPADLLQSTSYVEDPLPTEATLTETVGEIYKAALAADIDAKDASEIARELRGCSPFKAEQLAAQSLTREGIDRGKVRDNARKQINDTPGLSVESGPEKFSDIGGLTAIRDFLARYFAGPRRPDLVVRIEEIEKALAGVGTETSGTSGDALGTLLTAMEDNRWTGLLAYGVSGCGKSLIAKAAANEFGARAIRFDLNACKGSLVGQSERQIRQAMDVLKAIGGERVFFIASMNQIASLPPELRRRFAAGTWYFDVPDDGARQAIWQISAAHFGVAWDGYDAESLTGADIRDIVQRSYELGCTTTEAARYHVPLCKSAPDAIGQSRADATGRYLDANAGGPYRDPTSPTTRYDRSIQLD